MTQEFAYGHRDPRVASDAPWLVGGGEMGAIMRSLDWSRTPLGAIDTWPQPLCTAVSICLGSRHPIVLWWGPERVMFYNDAYRPMLGAAKHPQFLGRPGRDCWSEIWHVIGPMMDQVIATGEATWSEDLMLLMLRSGYLEETYFTFSYSPIRDQQGVPRGIFNACSETTTRVLADRRVRLLRELAASVAATTAEDAARQSMTLLGHCRRDIPFALLYLADGTDLRLAGSMGVPEAASIANPSCWPVMQVFATGEGLAVSIDHRREQLPREPWDAPAERVMVLPLANPGAVKPKGVLVLGINPRRAFDDDYRGFFDLVAGQIAAAMTNAGAYDLERKRGEALAALDVVSAAGLPACAVAMIEDISDRKRAEAELRLAVNVRDEFLAMASHELKTPVAALELGIANCLRLAAEPAPPIDKIRSRMHIASQLVDRLTSLLDNLLNVTRITTKQFQVARAPVDLREVVHSAVSQLRDMVDRSGSLLTLHAAERVPVIADARALEGVFYNLIANAAKYGRGRPIEVSLSSEARCARLRIVDQGIGIATDDQVRIFERFERAAPSQHYGGLGIGLWIARNVIEAHDGTIRVSSQPDRGSTFEVELPLVPTRIDDA